jgi:hypothetical protein
VSAGGLELALVAAALVTITIAAVHVQGIARVFLIAQAAYWSLSYLARPALLLWVQPRPQYADNVADPRLAVLGYDHGIAVVLQPVAFGLWVYAAAVVAFAAWARRHPRGAHRRQDTATDLVPTLWTVYAVGLVGRVVTYATGAAGSAGDLDSPNAILSFVAQLASVGALGLIIFLRPARRGVTVTVIGALLTVELLWTVAVESKTPVMSAALAIGIRFAILGWTRLRVVAILAISCLAIVGFGWLQGIKQTDQERSSALVANANYPQLVQPYLSLLRRFDLLEAATDSYYMSGRTWLAPTEVLRHSALSLVPEQLTGAEKLQSGSAWAREVRGSSLDMTSVSVSLAEGNINEGYVLGGYAGVAVGVLFTFVLLLLVVRALQARHIFFLSLGLALSAPPALFERGILGSMEVSGKALQLAVVIWVIDMAVREYRRPLERAPVIGSAPSGNRTVTAATAKG